MADATVFCMEHYNEAGHINIGSQTEITIKGLAELVRDVVEYKGTIIWDGSKPDGTPRKLMDSTKLYAMGWNPTIDLRSGVEAVYKEFKATEYRDK